MSIKNLHGILEKMHSFERQGLEELNNMEDYVYHLHPSHSQNNSNNKQANKHNFWTSQALKDFAYFKITNLSFRKLVTIPGKFTS